MVPPVSKKTMKLPLQRSTVTLSVCVRKVISDWKNYKERALCLINFTSIEILLQCVSQVPYMLIMFDELDMVDKGCYHKEEKDKHGLWS